MIVLDGKIIVKRDKVHLFRGEKTFFKPGTNFEVFDINGIKFGVTVCYNVAFPESV